MDISGLTISDNLVQDEGTESEMHEDTQETPEERGFPASASIITTNAEAQAEIIHVENTESANQSTLKQSKPTNVFRAPQSRNRKMVHDISAAFDKLGKVVQSIKTKTIGTHNETVSIHNFITSDFTVSKCYSFTSVFK
uniref:Uncharacterized protein n=1 Tax=Timema monikensis TaxID=170555 RepID=A0A7R9HM29_9NEOP|nr:unnamed protein product [Timema monikensis]